MKKLSPSSIKLLLKDQYEFINKFTSNIDITQPNIHFAIWTCLHSIAEYYNDTGMLDKEIGILELSKILEDNILTTDEWETVMFFTDQEIDTIVDVIDNTSKNMNGVLLQWWIAEMTATTDDFIGRVDLMKDDVIYDYKFVSKFAIEWWLFDPMPWYLIQMSIYSIWYEKEYWKKPERCEIIEILKWDTTITNPQYMKKDYLIDLIRQQNPKAEIDEKLTKDKLVEIYKPKDRWSQSWIFPVDDYFMNIGQEILNLAISIRNDIVSSTNADIDDKKQLSNNIKLNLKSFKELVLEATAKYYKINLAVKD